MQRLLQKPQTLRKLSALKMVAHAITQMHNATAERSDTWH
jgi:hypothetical protein